MRNNRITGQDYQLNWGDFRAPPPRNPGSRAAFTSATFSINFTINSYEEPLDPAVARALPRTTGRPRTAAQRGTRTFSPDDVQVSVSPDRGRMWSVVSARTPALLAHEQGHYSIVALIMQNLWYDLLSPPNLMTATNPDDLFGPAGTFTDRAAAQTWANGKTSEARALIARLESGNGRDGVYDTQTNHGLNTAVQANWNRAFFLASSQVSGLRFTLALSSVGISI